MKKATSLVVTLMLWVSLAVPALAKESASGICGESLTWVLSEDGTLTIEGTGSMENYYHFIRPWSDYREQVKTVIINEGITSIGNTAFFDCSALTSVTIPSSVASIGNYAFENCSLLTSVAIPDSVTSIGDFAFENCSLLTSVAIPDSVTSIGDYAFENCSSLTNVILSNSVSSTGDHTFRGCSSLTSVTIPRGVTSIGWCAFVGCSSLTSVIIPDGVTYIGDSAFAGCSSLTSVAIPDSVTTIGDFAFSDTDLTDVYYGGSEEQWKHNFTGFFHLPLDLNNATIHYNSAMPSTPAPAGVSVTVKGEAVEWTDAEPFIDGNNRTLVPLRAVADAMGLDVSWDAGARVGSFTDGSKTISFPIGSKTALTSDGGNVEMDTEAIIVNDRTYAPIRYLAQYFGYTVGWDPETRTVSIT